MSIETRPAVPHIDYYYDSHPTEEDLMGESTSQDLPVRHLIDLLLWLFRGQAGFFPRNLQIYQTDNSDEYPFSPDVAVFKGYTLPDPQLEDVKSWRVGNPDRPIPDVVFEFASTSTVSNDLDDKPGKYARMGVPEYFAYDARPEWEARTPRLRGWYALDGAPVELLHDRRGWLWSTELDSWLVPDGAYLRLYDRTGAQRPTGEEAERAEKEGQKAEKERLKAEQEQLKAERERLKAERERETLEKESALAERDRAWAKLKELGIDPDSL